MNLLIATDNYPPYIGGVARLMETVCHSFPPEAVRVIAPSWPGDAEMDARTPYRVQRIRSRSRLPMGLRHKLDTAASMARFERAVLADVRRDRPSYVLFNSVWPTGIVGLRLRALGVPYVIFAHGREIMQRRSWPLDRLRRRALQEARYVICNSRYCRELVLDQGVSPDRAVVSCPTIDPSRFAEPPDLDAFKEREGLTGRPVLVTVGWVMRRKGFREVIEALPEVLAEFPNLVYVIVGEADPHETDHPQELESLAERLGVAEHVRFAGNRDIPSFLHACDINVMPSLYDPAKRYVETFGITFLEAGACGKAVIGGDSAGMRDAVADGESGLLVKPEVPGAVAGAILKLLRDPDLCRRLGEQGYERVLRDFTLDRFRRDMSALLGDAAPADRSLDVSLSRTDGD